MAEAITIPSPSVFLRNSPDPPTLPGKPAQDVRQPVAEAKKKAVPRRSSVKAGGAGAAGGATVKPKQSKSRNGCATCKAKRLKCGEERPSCLSCQKRNVECGGYKKDFKWRPFEETNVKLNIDRQNRVSPQGQASANSSKPTSPPTEMPSRPASAHTDRPGARKDSKRSCAADEDPIISLPQRPAKAKRKSRVLPQAERPATPVEVPPEPTPQAIEDVHGTQDEEDAQDIPNTEELSGMPFDLLALSSGSRPFGTNGLGLSPTLTEILYPFSEQAGNDEDYFNFPLPESPQYLPPLAPVIDPLLTQQETLNDTVDEAPSPHESLGDLILNSPLATPLSGSAPQNVFGSWQGPASYLYAQPGFAQDSPEMLISRFDQRTCGVLSIMNGPTENPWRTLIWPLALKSPALYHAVLGMTAFHASADVPALRVTGTEHKFASIRYIQEGIRDSSMTDQTAIATALALGFSESWDQHTASGNTHIKGAQALVKRALADHQRRPLHGVELARLKFLCNAWVYMDVIARLTAVDSDESNDFDNTFLFAADSPNMVMGDDTGRTGFGIDFGTGIDARLDPLMGCAVTLFPLIGRVANLVRKVCRSNTNSPAVISQANDLMSALEAWDPPDYIERPEDVFTQVQHTLQTAEAYRLATLLHLHQSVPELPSQSASDLAQGVLRYLATVPPSSRTVIVQIYPLMVAGCEATTIEDRNWVRERWAAMDKRMRIGVIEKSLTVTEEVWRRRDAYEAQPTTRRKLVATADLQHARHRGVPFVRTASGVEGADPGRTGMVFSYVEADGDGKMNGENGKWPMRPSVGSGVKGSVDPAYTVRGHLHWVGVMWDWGWEVLLG